MGEGVGVLGRVVEVDEKGVREQGGGGGECVLGFEISIPPAD